MFYRLQTNALIQKIESETNGYEDDYDQGDLEAGEYL